MARAAAVGAACLYVIACALPVAVKVSLANGHPTGFHRGVEVLLLGWTTILGQPLLFVAWLSNVPWLAAMFGRLRRGPVRWVRRCALAGLACAAPAVLPIWDDHWFGDFHGRYWWFASYVLLAASCWVWPETADDSTAAEPRATADGGGT